jgi:hypothetical protein
MELKPRLCFLNVFPKISHKKLEIYLSIGVQKTCFIIVNSYFFMALFCLDNSLPPPRRHNMCLKKLALLRASGSDKALPKRKTRLPSVAGWLSIATPNPHLFLREQVGVVRRDLVLPLIVIYNIHFIYKLPFLSYL